MTIPKQDPGPCQYSKDSLTTAISSQPIQHNMFINSERTKQRSQFRFLRSDNHLLSSKSSTFTMNILSYALLTIAAFAAGSSGELTMFNDARLVKYGCVVLACAVIFLISSHIPCPHLFPHCVFMPALMKACDENCQTDCWNAYESCDKRATDDAAKEACGQTWQNCAGVTVTKEREVLAEA